MEAAAYKALVLCDATLGPQHNSTLFALARLLEAVVWQKEWSIAAKVAKDAMARLEAQEKAGQKPGGDADMHGRNQLKAGSSGLTALHQQVQNYLTESKNAADES